MNSTTGFTENSFTWTPQPQAASFVLRRTQDMVGASPWLRTFQRRLLTETGTRLSDWIDHLVVDDDPARLVGLGFVRDDHEGAWTHPGGLFPRIVLASVSNTAPTIGIKIESIDPFLNCHGLHEAAEIVGEVGARLRMATVPLDDVTLRAVERHGQRGFCCAAGESTASVARWLQTFRDRDRSLERADFQEQFVPMFAAAAREVGRDWACDLFFTAEREYWQGRNHAARIQRARQERLGLGWANHDHHTYRSGRESFAGLIACLEAMGFTCRERFYAGSEAGWGAQVLEQPECGLVVFADVDLSDDEVLGDFAHEGLEPRQELGTVGLWCELHGDSFLQAGMHHLECQFDFDAAREQLLALGIETMAPFTDFPYLRQAFTKGETWPVRRPRLDALVERGALSAAQANKFAEEGAIGSHLEILERNDGYKGFNQTGISQIIRQTDPRA